MSTIRPVALISGASRGIGAAIAERLGLAGFRLALLARQASDLQAVALRTGLAAEDCLCLAVDLQVPEAVEQAAAAALAHFGQVDVLVNNAGIGHFGKMEHLTTAELLAMLHTNVVGSWVLTRALLPAMQARETGLLVNILSDAARRTFAGGTAYCASKFAQDGLFGSLRHELAQSPIRVCNVYPGLVNTYFNGKTPSAPQPHKLEAWQVAEAVWQIIEDGGEPAELMVLPSN